MSNSSEVVLLFGAGASHSLGIPAMGGMFDEFVKDAKSRKSKNDLYVCDLLTKELGVSKDLEEFLLASNIAIDFPTQGLFKLVGKVIAPRGGEKLKKFKAASRTEVSKIKRSRKSILDFMSGKCFQFDRDKAVDQLSGIVKILQEKNYSIFSTNYDFSIEYVAEEIGLGLNDNFYAQGRRFLWDPKIQFANSTGLELVKLHGSVTWYLDGSNQIEKLDTPTTINRAGVPVERLVVFPTRFKDIYNQNFFALYSKFLSALTVAKCLVIIGHSLRDEYLRAAIIERHRKGDFNIVIVDPVWPAALPKDFKPAKKGTAGPLTHIAQSFENFSDELAHVLSKGDSDSVAADCVEILRQITLKKDKVKIRGRIAGLKVGRELPVQVAVDVYVAKRDRPVYLYAWLEGLSKESDGTVGTRISSDSLVIDPAPITFGLEGTFVQDVSINIGVPKYRNWLAAGGKVKLTIALVKGGKSLKPRSLGSNNIIASDSRELNYAE